MISSKHYNDNEIHNFRKQEKLIKFKTKNNYKRFKRLDNADKEILLNKVLPSKPGTGFNCEYEFDFNHNYEDQTLITSYFGTSNGYGIYNNYIEFEIVLSDFNNIETKVSTKDHEISDYIKEEIEISLIDAKLIY